MSIDAAFTHFPSLTPDRLILRQIRPTDAEAMFETFSDAEAMRYYGHEPHQSLDHTHALIERIQANYDAREAIRWGITLKGEDTAIGSCGFHHFGPGFHHAEIGYELQRAHWGQGIIAKAVSVVLTYGFTKLGLHRVEAIIDDANERSKGLLLKLGFTYEGKLRQRYFFRGRFEDEYYYGLLKDEWQIHAQA